MVGKNIIRDGDDNLGQGAQVGLLIVRQQKDSAPSSGSTTSVILGRVVVVVARIDQRGSMPELLCNYQ